MHILLPIQLHQLQICHLVVLGETLSHHSKLTAAWILEVIPCSSLDSNHAYYCIPY